MNTHLHNFIELLKDELYNYCNLKNIEDEYFSIHIHLPNDNPNIAILNYKIIYSLSLHNISISLLNDNMSKIIHNTIGNSDYLVTTILDDIEKAEKDIYDSEDGSNTNPDVVI